MAASGQTVVDCGPFPGVADAEFTLAGLTGIVDVSQVDAWVQATDVAAGFSADAVPVNALVYAERGANFSGIADSKLGIYSFWISPHDLQAAGGTTSLLTTAGGSPYSFNSSMSATNKRITILLGGTGGGGLIPDVSLQANLEVGFLQAWHHVLASWDIGANAGTLWVNDVLYDNTISRGADEPTVYTGFTNWRFSDQAGLTPVRGFIAEQYFCPGQYLDFNVAANRRKFSAFVADRLVPVDLGADGSLPTGTVPILYQHIGAGEACANWLTNRGSGGNFALVATSGNAVAQLPSFGQGLVLTPGHSIEEHLADPPFVKAYSPSAAGASMKVRVSSSYLSKLAASQRRSDVPLVCGKWNLGWSWV